VLKKELEAAGSGPAKLVEAFCQARLFATDETNLTVAHEALLTRWDRLNGWIERNQEFFREVRFLRQQLEAYENSGKKAGWLLRGQPLEKALALRKQYRRSLNAEELDYIQKSARKARQGRLVIRSLTGLLVVMIAGAIVVRLIWPILRAWHYRTLNAANVAKARVNSLGMKFVEAGTPGVLFSVYDVRVEDWRQFAQSEDYKNKFSDGKKGTADNNGKTNTAWENPFLNYKQSEEAPVVDVSWYDAVAFCEWLTRTDRAAHKIADNENYDLPTDAQWSKAVGLNEPDAGTPKDKDSKVQGYPWGTAWPPPGGAGNYADGLTNDVFPFTSPVGSFASYHYELCDMGGNAWQWCKDNYAGGVNDNDELKVLRGGSWSNSDSDALSSSDRYDGPQADERMNIIGFRCVLVTTP